MSELVQGIVIAVVMTIVAVVMCFFIIVCIEEQQELNKQNRANRIHIGYKGTNFCMEEGGVLGTIETTTCKKCKKLEIKRRINNE